MGESRVEGEGKGLRVGSVMLADLPTHLAFRRSELLGPVRFLGLQRLHHREREFCIDNLLVRIHYIIVMFRWTDLAPWFAPANHAPTLG